MFGRFTAFQFTSVSCCLKLGLYVTSPIFLQVAYFVLFYLVCFILFLFVSFFSSFSFLFRNQ